MPSGTTLPDDSLRRRVFRPLPQLRPLLRLGERVDGKLLGFPVDFQLEALLQQGLKHQPDLLVTRRPSYLGVNVVPVPAVRQAKIPFYGIPGLDVIRVRHHRPQLAVHDDSVAGAAWRQVKW